MESMWKDLLLDILEKDIAFLPLDSVCRFRAVSKTWNRLISHPDFAARHARASPPGEYALITMRYGIRPKGNNPANVVEGWDVLDVANNRFFTLSGDFLWKYVHGQGIAFVPGSEENQRNFLAADGGLFCVYYLSSISRTELLVCNPILRTAKRLPPFPEVPEGRSYQKVVMSTNRVSMEYEVFVICPTTVQIYESKTARWRTASTRPPPDLTDIAWKWYPASFFVKNEDHKLVVLGDSVQKGILSYDKQTGVVSKVGIDFPCAPESKPQLVLCRDRLFCVTVLDYESTIDEFDNSATDIGIYEIIFARKKCKQLAWMPLELADWLKGDGLVCEYGYMPDDFIVASGSADTIVIFSNVGRCVGYSLSGKGWHQYPYYPNFRKEPFYSSCSVEYQRLCESNYCLSLCPISQFYRQGIRHPCC